MTPTQDFENYPEFANSGQKSQPNDAKYSAGFIPSDVLPAEWLNWFLNGATKGVTALNTGVKSVEQEINTVLESRSVTPDIKKAGQLLAVLNMIKEEAINEAWPVGITYTQYPQQKSPQELFPKTTWVEISYDGAFFRASGGNAAAFIEKSGVLSKQNQSLQSHSHTIKHTHTRGTMNITGQIAGAPCGENLFSSSYANGAFSLVGWGYGKTKGVNWNPDSSLIANFVASRTWTGNTSEPTNGNSGSTGDTETRPSNYSVRIWKRTA